MCQNYWGNRFDRYPSLGDLAESYALQLMKVSLVFCREDSYGCLEHSSKVLSMGFMLYRNV